MMATLPPAARLYFSSLRLSAASATLADNARNAAVRSAVFILPIHALLPVAGAARIGIPLPLSRVRSSLRRTRGRHVVQHRFLVVGLQQMFTRFVVAGILVETLPRVRDVRVHVIHAALVALGAFRCVLRNDRQQLLVV